MFCESRCLSNLKPNGKPNQSKRPNVYVKYHIIEDHAQKNLAPVRLEGAHVVPHDKIYLDNQPNPSITQSLSLLAFSLTPTSLPQVGVESLPLGGCWASGPLSPKQPVAQFQCL